MSFMDEGIATCLRRCGCFGDTQTVGNDYLVVYEGLNSRPVKQSFKKYFSD